MTNLKSEEVYNHLSDLINNMSFSSKNYVDAAMRDHRTLQQNHFRLIVDLLKGWEEMGEAGRFDLRNEHTCKSAKIMLDALREANNGTEYTPSI